MKRAYVRFLINPLITSPLVSSVINSLFFLAFLLFNFLVFISYVEKKKIWEAIGRAFHVMAVQWKKLLIVYGFIVLTGVILSLVFYFLEITVLRYQLPSTLALVNFGLLLLLVSWMRGFVVKKFS